MKSLLILLIAALPQLARAYSIKCVFTEPFISVEYNLDTETVTYANIDGNTYVDAAVTHFRDGKLEVRAADHDLRLVIDPNKTGSDGMSDKIYPYDARLNKNLYGGCSSNNRPVLDQDGKPLKQDSQK